MNTPEEGRVTIANCELALHRNDPDSAISMLRAIPVESSHHVRAKIAMADIYLKHRKDRTMYARCYQELVERQPDQQRYMLLGEAYMQIEEPQKAIQALEQARLMNPSDMALASKIGKALITTHDYDRALSYYESIRSGEGVGLDMQLDLAQLLIKLRRLEDAERVIIDTINTRKDSDDPPVIQERVDCMLLLAKVYKGYGGTKCMEAYDAALEDQKLLLSKIRGDQPDNIESQKVKAADICTIIASEREGMPGDTCKPSTVLLTQ